MDFKQLSNQIPRFLIKNSPAILTGVGVAGALTTAVLTGNASFKAAQIIALRQGEHDLEEKNHLFSTKENFQLVWRLYIPAVGTAAITVAAIIFANRVSDRRTAAIATAYALSQSAFEEYKEKVIEKMTPKKEQALRDELNQDRVNNNPPEQNLVIIGKGDVLCYEAFTGRYFTCDMETLRKGMNDINQQVMHDSYASLTDFYDRIGLPSTKVSDDFGWNTDELLDLKFSPVIANDQRPAIAFEYNLHPVKGYNRLS